MRVHGYVVRAILLPSGVARQWLLTLGRSFLGSVPRLESPHQLPDAEGVFAWPNWDDPGGRPSGHRKVAGVVTGDVAQLGARQFGRLKAAGSIPAISTSFQVGRELGCCYSVAQW